MHCFFFVKKGFHSKKKIISAFKNTGNFIPFDFYIKIYMDKKLQVSEYSNEKISVRIKTAKVIEI